MITFIKPEFEFTDERGSITQLCHEKWSQVNFFTSKKGVFRGGHYHKLNREAFYIINGAIEIKLEKDNQIKTVTVKANDFFAIEPYTIHSFNFLENSLMITMYDLGVENKDGTKDIYTKELRCI